MGFVLDWAGLDRIGENLVMPTQYTTTQLVVPITDQFLTRIERNASSNGNFCHQISFPSFSRQKVASSRVSPALFSPGPIPGCSRLGERRAPRSKTGIFLIPHATHVGLRTSLSFAVNPRRVGHGKREGVGELSGRERVILFFAPSRKPWGAS